MNSFIFSFPLIILFFLFHFSSADDSSSSTNLNDDAFVAFVRGPAEFEQFFEEKGDKSFQSKKLLGQIYGTCLGILFYIRQQNWRCDKFRFDTYKQTCEKHQQYMRIFDEYLFHIHAQHAMKRPKFYNGKRENTTFVEVVDRLAIVINSPEEEQVIYLENEEYYGQYLMKEERSAEKIDEKTRVEFDKIMGKMWEKVMGMEQIKKGPKNDWQLAMANSSTSAQSTSEAVHNTVNVRKLVWALPRYELRDVVEDKAFLEFLEQKYKQITRKVSKYNGLSDVLGQLLNKRANNNEMKLSQFYLTKKKWICDQVDIKFINECERLRGYMDILYEYLFRKRFGFTALKPLFQKTPIYGLFSIGRPFIMKLGTILSLLFTISCDYLTETPLFMHIIRELKLLNEKELDYKPIAENGNSMTLQESGVQVAIEGSSSIAVDGESEINAASFEVLFRRAFDKELKDWHQEWALKLKAPAEYANWTH